MSETAASRPWGQPLANPLNQAPTGIGRVEAIAMLQQATTGLPLGAYDRRVLVCITSWGSDTVAAVASLLTRARCPHTADPARTTAPIPATEGA